MNSESFESDRHRQNEERRPTRNATYAEDNHSVESRLGLPDTHQWPLTIFFLVLVAFTAYIPLQSVIQLESFDIILAIVLLVAVITTSRRRRWMLIGVLVVIPPFLLGALQGVNIGAPRIAYILYFLSLSFFLILVIISVLLEIISTKRVTIHTISGAMSIFILLTMLWAVGYTIVELMWPESFAAPISAASSNYVDSIGYIFGSFFFFSLVTITTAGYGDITPISPAARSLTSLELVIGQVFLTILIAWLVGMFIADNIKDHD